MKTTGNCVWRWLCGVVSPAGKGGGDGCRNECQIQTKGACGECASVGWMDYDSRRATGCSALERARERKRVVEDDKVFEL